MIEANAKIVISEWSGRLGNNLIQLSNGIYICWKRKCELVYPDHKFLKKKEINFRETESDLTYMTRFYDPIDCNHVYPSIAERRHIMLHFIKDMLTFDIDYDHEEQKGEEEQGKLVIQMRSGELFLKNPNAKYVPSPLSYFTKIIEDYKYNEVLIVCEDRSNPVIGTLEEMYPFCTVQSSDLISDIKAIANAKHLCTTVGTFGFVFTLLNKNIQRLFVDNIPKQLLDFGYFNSQNKELGFEVLKYDIQDYIKFGEWHNTKTQYDLVFGLTRDKIVQIPSVMTMESTSKYYEENTSEFFSEFGHLKLLKGLFEFVDIFWRLAEEKNMICIDVGCCVGEYLNNFSKIAKNENVPVIAFEPNVENLPKLREKLSNNANVKLYECCLSNEEASNVGLYDVDFEDSKKERNGLASLRNKGRFICETDVFRLDSILDDLPFDVEIGFIKIDTEGNDTNIIKGLGDYLSKTHYIIFESSDFLDGETGPGHTSPLKDIVEYLDRKGFDTYKIGSKKLLPMNGKYWHDTYEKKKFWSNSFAIRKGDKLINQLIDSDFCYKY